MESSNEGLVRQNVGKHSGDLLGWIVSAKERRSRCGYVLLDVTDIRKSVCVYLNTFEMASTRRTCQH
jgi:hypothetical protein